MKNSIKTKLSSILFAIYCIISFTFLSEAHTISATVYSVDNIPLFSNNAYIEINNNIPAFSSKDKTNTNAFEKYSELDSLGRCGVAYANICKEIIPTEARSGIGMIKPSGWQTVKYDFVDGKYLYNRCHLIGYQLAGENANTRNLITGTRYLNIQGMLPFEDKVSQYVERTNNHVLYRVTPIFQGNNLLASGVQIEAYSVEDKGKGISFNVYCYNAQPGVVIDYATGESKLVTIANKETEKTSNNSKCKYILNKNTKKFHYPTCDSVTDMKEKNKEYFNGTREEAIEKGFSPCKRCNP